MQRYYEHEANELFPAGCRCPDDSGSCDWCEVYYNGANEHAVPHTAIEDESPVGELVAALRDIANLADCRIRKLPFARKVVAQARQIAQAALGEQGAAAQTFADVAAATFGQPLAAAPEPHRICVPCQEGRHTDCADTYGLCKCPHAAAPQPDAPAHDPIAAFNEGYQAATQLDAADLAEALEALRRLVNLHQVTPCDDEFCSHPRCGESSLAWATAKHILAKHKEKP